MLGTVTLNGITDQELIKLIEVKDKSAGKLLVESLGAPHQGASSGPQQVGKPQQSYDGVKFYWNEVIGAKFAAEALTTLAPTS
jgi:hypothetical protein